MRRYYYHLSGADHPSLIFRMYKGFAGPVAMWLYRNTGVSANLLTFLRIIWVIIALLCFSYGEYKMFHILGGAFLIINTFFDTVDGDLARLRKNETQLGEWMEVISGNPLSQIHSLMGFAISFGIWQFSGNMSIWYVLFFIIWGYNMNGWLRNFGYHQSPNAETLSIGFDETYNEVMKHSYLKTIYHTSAHLDSWIILISAIAGSLFGGMIAICLINNIRWICRFLAQIWYLIS